MFSVKTQNGNGNHFHTYALDSRKHSHELAADAFMHVVMFGPKQETCGNAGFDYSRLYQRICTEYPNAKALREKFNAISETAAQIGDPRAAGAFYSAIVDTERFDLLMGPKMRNVAKVLGPARAYEYFRAMSTAKNPHEAAGFLASERFFRDLHFQREIGKMEPEDAKALFENAARSGWNAPK